MIGIIDYGVGNLRSVQKACEYMGMNAVITADPEVIGRSSHIILPGVGAFSEAMNQLREKDLIKVIEHAIQSGKPFLGICLGMQLLFEISYENGINNGLGILPGEVVHLSDRVKVPHMGWNSLRITDHPLFHGVMQGAYVYFVHSYYVKTHQKDIIIASTHYDIEFTVAVAKQNIFGMQFHPEKSGNTGLQILKNFGGL